MEVDYEWEGDIPVGQKGEGAYRTSGVNDGERGNVMMEILA